MSVTAVWAISSCWSPEPKQLLPAHVHCVRAWAIQRQGCSLAIDRACPCAILRHALLIALCLGGASAGRCPLPWRELPSEGAPACSCCFPRPSHLVSGLRCSSLLDLAVLVCRCPPVDAVAGRIGRAPGWFDRALCRSSVRPWLIWPCALSI